jgi:hypothetical protein
VLVVLSIAVFLWLAALVVDYGQMAVVYNELKKAAEAGARAGAGNKGLLPYTGTPATPNWSVAESWARQTVLSNQAGGQALTDCQVTTGYFSLTTKTLPLQSQGIVPTAYDVPAVRVQVAKSVGNNGGPLQLFFASPWGVNTVNLGAQAVATISYQLGVPVGTVMPLAVLDTVDARWTSDTSFLIGENQTNGQFTSFKVDSNAASYVAGLIANGNPSVLQVGDLIHIQPGVAASNYGNAASLVGKTVYLPLVANIAAGSQKITGFSAFRVEEVSQPQKYIKGHFDKNAAIPKATKVSPFRPNPLSAPSPIPQLVYIQ